MNQVLTGQTSFSINYKAVKKYLFYPKGLIDIVDMLNNVIFG
jgi:ABC-type phosphate/phosphonate transport system ATPase subunit